MSEKSLEFDLHGYHPNEIDLADILKQAWETGATSIKLIHGHGRNRGISPGFVNTNTGYFGLCIRRSIRGNSELKPWVKISTMDCSEMGSTTVQLKPNPSPTRGHVDLPDPGKFLATVPLDASHRWMMGERVPFATVDDIIVVEAYRCTTIIDM